MWAQGRGINYLFVLSCVFAIAEATSFPLLSVAVAEATIIALMPQHNPDTIAFWCGILAIIAVSNVIFSYFRTLAAHLHGVHITNRLRNAVMRQLISQSASWYDLLPNASSM
jgi:ABC-type multidrug transport system fused ATPase/permease subunit